MKTAADWAPQGRQTNIGSYCGFCSADPLERLIKHDIQAAPDADGSDFVAAGLGAIFAYFLTRRTERFKQLQGLRAAAYVDFLRGFAKVAIAQSDTARDERSFLEEREGIVLMADAKARIAIYGSKKAVSALSAFIAQGSQTRTPQGMLALTRMCEVMRDAGWDEKASFDDIHKLLFGR